MKIQKFKRPLAWASLIGLLTVTNLTAQDGNLTEDEAFFYEEFDESAGVYDPFESVNRFTFEFNDFVFSNALQPLVDAYTAITPDTVEEGASNFFHNLRYPVRLTSNLLQGRFKGAWIETGRFAINSTVGIVGILTPADDYESFARIESEKRAKGGPSSEVLREQQYAHVGAEHAGDCVALGCPVKRT